VEAVHASNLRLAVQFNAEDFFELLQEDDFDECSDINGRNAFDMDVEQIGQMQAAVRGAIEAWQTNENLTFKGYLIQAPRNQEFILPIEVDAQGDPNDAQNNDSELCD
jgi:hypothetical protein